MKKIFAFICLLLLIILWKAVPFYEFMAHRGSWSFLPWTDFIQLPKQAPAEFKLYDDDYSKAGSEALQALAQHREKINAPAVSFAVGIEGEVVWAGAVGWSDVGEKAPVSLDTQFRIGSTSKALTAMGVATLVDNDKIELDKPLSGYFQELPNQSWENITPRQLASHTSGLPHYPENEDYLGLYETLSLDSYYETANQALEVFDGSVLLFEPGMDFHYSTFNTVLLSAVVENVTGMTFSDFMDSAVFSPLGMSNTMRESLARKESNSQLATFYWNDNGQSASIKPWRTVDLSHRLAGGGFVSTSVDLVKLGNSVLTHSLVNGSTSEIFLTPQQLPDGNNTPHNYALGWRMPVYDFGEVIGEVTFINHGGVSRGAQSLLAILPEHNITFALNINSNTDSFSDFSAVVKPILELFIKDKKALNNTVD